MSFPVTAVIQLDPTTTAAGSYAAILTKLRGDWADGDWIFLAIACSNATAGVTLAHDGTTGWSEVVELDVSSGVREKQASGPQPQEPAVQQKSERASRSGRAI